MLNTTFRFSSGSESPDSTSGKNCASPSWQTPVALPMAHDHDLFLVTPICALKDNYIWLIIHPASSTCAIVDPGEAAPVLKALQTQSLKPSAILLTHHHADHTGGVAQLLENYDMPVFGPQQEAIPTLTHPLSGGEKIQIANTELTVLAIPGHTRGHLAYYGHGALFSGDTLFTGGCGRVFEGTMTEMYTSLKTLSSLPSPTKIYCGHEYTAANLSFASKVEPKNRELQQRIKDTDMLRAHNMPTVPSTLALEKATNPFLRCQESTVQQAAELHCGTRFTEPAEVFRVLRDWKNS